MTAPFDGPDLLVGEIAAIRTFDLRSDGALWPVFAADRPWVDGPQEASCVRHAAAAAPGCKCGYWAYGSVEALRDQPAHRNVAAVVSCWGRVTPGTRGLRAQHARLDALWLSPRVSPRLAGRVAERYPHTAIYRDQERMLAEHPLTVLPSYRALDKRSWKITAIRAFIQTFLLAVVVVGLLPHSAFRVDWVHALRTQFLQVLGYSVLTTTVQWFVNRGAGPRVAAQIGRVFLVVAGLICWLCATLVGGFGGVLLRLPLLLWCGRWVVNRTIRFLPKRATATPASGPPAL